jgi:molybdopterin-guanine dinucleotide biosynthesis protein A
VYISGKADGPYAQSGVNVVPDQWVDAGPLGAIATMLSRITTDWLIVLAVDMPAMTAEYLRGLAEQATQLGKAVVPRQSDGHWEPLAAVYPRSALTLAEMALRGGRRKMEEFVEKLAETGALAIREVRSNERFLFQNWNAPEDVPGK